MLRLRPCTISEARRFVGKHHRHNLPPVSALFAVAVENGELCGVAIAGLPKARMLMDGTTVEIIRVCTDGSDNACSMLYGAMARAAKALGYRRAITYTLASEPGTSLRAAGWERDAEVPASHAWSHHGNTEQLRLVTTHRPTEAKVRWVRRLSA